MTDKRTEDDAKDDNKPNGGFRYGLQFHSYEQYYGANAIRRTNAGLIEFYSDFPAYNRIGRQCEDGTIIFEFNPKMTIEEFRALQGAIV